MAQPSTRMPSADGRGTSSGGDHRATRSSFLDGCVKSESGGVAAVESPLAHKIQWYQDHDSNAPIPQLSLHKLRFLAAAVIGVTATGAGLACFLDGVAIDEAADQLGTSKNADAKVAKFQAINGFVWAAVGLLLEEYFKIFIAVMLIYFANRKWHPRDTVTQGPSQFKIKTLFWFTPLMMYVINVGLSSVFIEHKVNGLARAFVDSDLVSVEVVAVSTKSSSGDTSATSVLNTVLRTAVLNQAIPFQINGDSTCATTNLKSTTKKKKPTTTANTTSTGGNSSSETTSEEETRKVTLPKLQDLQSTSVTFGFPPRPWNLDAMPFALTATAGVELSLSSDMKETEQKLQEFLASSKHVTFDTLTDLMVQGLTLHGKASTDSNMFVSYECDVVIENDLVLAARKLLEEETEASSSSSDSNSDSEETAGDDSTTSSTTPRCFGVGNYLQNAQDLRASATPKTAETLIRAVPFMDGIDADKTTLVVETFEISPKINLTMVTIDLAFEDNAKYMYMDTETCDEKTFTFKDPESWHTEYPDEKEYLEQQKYMCSPTFLPYDEPFQQCGEKNCVLEDLSAALTVNKQVLMAPFAINCDPKKVVYDQNVFSWFPTNCEHQENAMFVYGMGSYFTGNLEVQGDDMGPIITNPRRHFVLTFAKLDWQFEPLHDRFNAQCDDPNGCMGLVHALHNIQGPQNSTSKPRVLLVAKDKVPTSFLDRSLKDPVPLVLLREPKFYEGANLTYFGYEYIDLAKMNTTYNPSKETLGLTAGKCSLYIDGYLNQVESNHYIIQDPRQPVYTSAMYYLFQDATVKEVILDKKANQNGVADLSVKYLGISRMKGDLETKEIRYSIPLPSAVSTLVGIVMLLVYMGVILKWPREAVKLTDEQNPAAKYADVLVDDLYPERIHTRRLRLGDGSIVEMDDYAAQKIVLRNVNAPDIPVVME